MVFQLLQVPAETSEVASLRPRRRRPEMAVTFTHRRAVNPLRLNLMITSLLESMELRRVKVQLGWVAPTLNVRFDLPGIIKLGVVEQAVGWTLAILAPPAIAPVYIVIVHDWPNLSG